MSELESLFSIVPNSDLGSRGKPNRQASAAKPEKISLVCGLLLLHLHPFDLFTLFLVYIKKIHAFYCFQCAHGVLHVLLSSHLIW